MAYRAIDGRRREVGLRAPAGTQLLLLMAGSVALAVSCSTSSVGGSGAPVTTAASSSTPSTAFARLRDGDTHRFTVPSESMAPTLHMGQVIAVEGQSGPLARGQVVVFNKPPQVIDPGILALVKRIIGLPGETISASGGAVYIDGKRLTEPWLPVDVTTDSFMPIRIPPGDCFVMGDNRANSSDSREFGPIPEDLVIGVVAKVLVPANQA